MKTGKLPKTGKYSLSLHIFVLQDSVLYTCTCKLKCEPMKETKRSCKSMIVRFHSITKVLPIDSAIFEENHLQNVHVTEKYLKHHWKSSILCPLDTITDA